MKDIFIVYRQKQGYCELYNVSKSVAQDMSYKDMLQLCREQNVYIPSLTIDERNTGEYERELYEFEGLVVVGDLIFNKQGRIYTSYRFDIEPRGFIKLNSDIIYVLCEEVILETNGHSMNEYELVHGNYGIVYEDVCQRVKLYEDDSNAIFSSNAYSFISMYNPRTETYYWTDKKGILWSGKQLHRNPKVSRGKIEADPLGLAGISENVLNTIPVIQPVLYQKLYKYLNELASKIVCVKAENRPPLFRLNNLSIVKVYLNEMLKQHSDELNKYISEKLSVYDTIFHIKTIQSNPTGKGIYVGVEIVVMPFSSLSPQRINYFSCGEIPILLNI